MRIEPPMYTGEIPSCLLLVSQSIAKKIKEIIELRCKKIRNNFCFHESSHDLE